MTNPTKQEQGCAHAPGRAYTCVKCLVKENERLRGALESLWPGLVLDLRYADANDDLDALRSRVETVRDALSRDGEQGHRAAEQEAINEHIANTTGVRP